MEEEVAPVFHEKFVPPEAESVTFVPPQTVLLGPAVAVSPDVTVTKTAAVSLQVPFETITV